MQDFYLALTIKKRVFVAMTITPPTREKSSAILLMFKAPSQTSLFNHGQRLWVVRLTGSQAALVRGKHRGRGRYVKGWVRFDKKGDAIPEMKEIPVSQEFYQKIRSGAESDEGYEDVI